MRIGLKLGGETIPLYFGMVAFEEMQKLVSSYMGTNKHAVDVAWSGYLNQCAIDGIHPEMTYGDLMLKLEEHFFSVEDSECNINDILKAFESSKAGSKLFSAVDLALDVINDFNNKVEKDTSKKKQIQKTHPKKAPTRKLSK